MKEFERLKNKTILLVDDEKIIRENISSMLKYFFKEVITAIDGYDALDKYEQNLPDVIITDLKMPNMGGIEFIKEIKKLSSSSYIIIVSAHTDTNFLLNALHDGVDRYIIKPIIEDELFESFRAYLKKIDKEEPNIINLAHDIKINFDTTSIISKEDEFHLNKKEIRLLKVLCKDIDKIISYEEIEDQVWGSAYMSLSAIRSVVRDLRKKLGSEYIINISGVGYKMR